MTRGDLFGFEVNCLAHPLIAGFANFSFANDVGSDEDFAAIGVGENLCPRALVGGAKLNSEGPDKK